MPYITETQRKRIQEQLEDGVLPRLDNAGELNYFISTIINIYTTDHFLNYQTINDVVGAVEGALAEYRRRVIDPYEDLKISANGDLKWPNLNG